MLNRNWAYWTLYSQDILWSLYVGRECCMTTQEKRPFAIPYVGSELDTNQWYWAPSKMPPQPSNIVRCFEASCDLMFIARRIFDFVYVLIYVLFGARRLLIVDVLLQERPWSQLETGEHSPDG